jgi:hypothetical protein
VLAAETAFGTLGVALTVVFAAIGIIGAIATAVTVVKSKTLEQNLELLRGAVADLTAENVRLTTERDMYREIARGHGYSLPPESA